jgi:hydrogenase large subunit
MATTIMIDPITRIEGHLGVEVTVDDVGGEQQVVEARATGTMFRGFEILLIGRDPRDAGLYSQRICGVCPVSHAMAACRNLDDAFGITPPDNGRILRNLVLGANFIQSHLLHFYHLSAVDYIDTTGILDQTPWTPRYVVPDMVGGATAQTFVDHYVAAFAARRRAHEMGAIFGGKLPMIGSFVVGGCTNEVTADNVAAFRALLTELRSFIDNVYVPDAQALATLFPDFSSIGGGPGNLLAFGVFDLDSAGSSRLLERGRYDGSSVTTMDPGAITEHLKHSWFTGDEAHPAQGTTVPDADKPGGYTWLKAPRYADQPYELGPLARMWVSGHYDTGISAMDRIVARALETQVIADAMDGWLDELTPGASGFTPAAIPTSATGAGLTEAPRGALGHWVAVEDSVVSRYQVITPTNWNASPRDDADVPGPLEAALVGTPVGDIAQPVEVIRVVHSFDPCLACAVHVLRPGETVDRSHVVLQPSPG